MRFLKKIIYSFLERHFFEGCSRFNSLEVRRKSRTKEQARDVFERIGAPHAAGDIFIWPGRAVRFVRKHGFPVILKPNFGTFSRGSYFPIRNWKEFWSAMIRTKLFWPRTVIEEYLEGGNFRVVVIEGKTMMVAHRFPPFVVGDGERTISDLIDEENRIREEMHLLPVIFRLGKKRIRKFLKKKNLDLQTVPKEGEKIGLGNLVALWAGGALVNIPLEKIPEKNHTLFQEVLKAFDSRIFGLDMLCEKSVEVPWDEQRCIFLEANSRPYLKMHDFPRFGEKPDYSADLKQLESLEVADGDIF